MRKISDNPPSDHPRLNKLNHSGKTNMLVEIETKDGVRSVTMNRPEKRNAMTDEMLEQLLAAFSGDAAPDERVTVLRGNGPSF
ncbi:MAG: enoyl-CoA hydratase/isomerase family protein, partial [Chromatiales bacterium]|nr:enoyl-CoA hydratase/isomerase family protein [Chromatiales bacterium]